MSARRRLQLGDAPAVSEVSRARTRAQAHHIPATVARGACGDALATPPLHALRAIGAPWRAVLVCPMYVRYRLSLTRHPFASQFLRIRTGGRTSVQGFAVPFVTLSDHHTSPRGLVSLPARRAWCTPCTGRGRCLQMATTTSSTRAVRCVWCGCGRVRRRVSWAHQTSSRARVRMCGAGAGVRLRAAVSLDLVSARALADSGVPGRRRVPTTVPAECVRGRPAASPRARRPPTGPEWSAACGAETAAVRSTLSAGGVSAPGQRYVTSA